MNYYLTVLKLAKKAKLNCKPNPAVGAVIEKNNKIIGTGFTRKYGSDHAEIQAIKSVKNKKDLINSTMYVSLEPCCIFGKTPPCTNAIIKNKIKKVIIGTIDPNPKINGKSIEILNKAGVMTELSFPEKIIKELLQLNEDFFKIQKTGQPFVAIKYAMTLDGKIAAKSGDSKWITNLKSRKHVHLLRSMYDSIVIGSNTLKTDNPELNIRYIKSEQNPLRIIIGTKYKFLLKNQNYKLLTDNNKSIFIVNSNTDRKIINIIKKYNKDVFLCKGYINNKYDMKKLFIKLSKKYTLNSFFVEGGSILHGILYEQECIDKVYGFIAPKITGDKTSLLPIKSNILINKISSSKSLTDVKIKYFDDNVLIAGYLKSVNLTK